MLLNGFDENAALHSAKNQLMLKHHAHSQTFQIFWVIFDVASRPSVVMGTTDGIINHKLIPHSWRIIHH